jgi:subfamily B ATP-binding cassette protein MsbA
MATGTYKRLLVFLRPHRSKLAGNIAANMTAAMFDAIAFALLIPFLGTLFGSPQPIPDLGWLTGVMERLVGAVVDQGTLPTATIDQKLRALTSVIVMIVALVFVKNVFVWIGGQFGVSLQERITRDLRDTVFRHMQRLPLGWFMRQKTGQVMSRILADAEQAKAVLAEVATRTVQSLSQVIATVFMLFTMSLRLTLVALLVAPLISLIIQPILNRLRKTHRRLRNDYGEINSVLQEVVSGIRLVKSYRGESYEDARFTSASGGYTRGMVRITRLSMLAGPITEVLATIVAVFVLWLGARQVFDQSLEASVLIAFMTFVLRLLTPLKQLAQAPTVAQQSLAAADRLFEVLDEQTEGQRDGGTRTVSDVAEGLEFEHVDFAYGESPVLTDISFTARRGDVVAFVGASGAGKSTLVDLIPRFIEPTAGKVTLDGVDLREIRLESLRALTGIVSQDTVLFNDTVRSNIAYGSGSRYTEDQIVAAAKAANAHAFITELAQGYDTILGERGTRLSGGQRQRLAIARALLADPPILILDEATSALDTESERLVQEAIDRLLTGRTVFVIAHRLSTIVHATQILVLDRGRIVERGRHADLLAIRGVYAKLYDLQHPQA